MELKIYSPTEDGFIKAIEWNHEDIKKEVAEKVSYYANVIYTDDQIKEAKADRAKLNKFVQALEAKRKEVKKQCLAPYEDFERKLKEITAIVNEPIMMIDQQVKGYEEQKKAEKQTKISELFENAVFPDWVKFERIFDTRWLNATVPMTTISKELIEKLEKIESDLSTLSSLPEFAFEAVEVYKTTLDLGKAIQEGHRLSEIQKRKQEYEAEQARQKAEAEAKANAEMAAMEAGEAVFENAPDVYSQLPTEPLREAICFRAYLTPDDAFALRH